jgi:hypothetical protein
MKGDSEKQNDMQCRGIDMSDPSQSDYSKTAARRIWTILDTLNTHVMASERLDRARQGRVARVLSI